MEETIERLERSLDYRFGHREYLLTALTHSSYANEQGCEHNERLEFLGDAVVELTVSEELFERHPLAQEGELTKLRSRMVNLKSLADLAKSLKLDVCLLLGRGEENQGGRTRDSLLADTVEAILGAVFLDGGYPAAKTVVLRLMADRWPKDTPSERPKDFKSLLQEFTQRSHKSRPLYRLASSSGPEHEKRFEVELTLPDGRTIRATASSMKKAEQLAARNALELLEPAD